MTVSFGNRDVGWLSITKKRQDKLLPCSLVLTDLVGAQRIILGVRGAVAPLVTCLAREPGVICKCDQQKFYSVFWFFEASSLHHTHT